MATRTEHIITMEAILCDCSIDTLFDKIDEYVANAIGHCEDNAETIETRVSLETITALTNLLRDKLSDV